MVVKVEYFLGLIPDSLTLENFFDRHTFAMRRVYATPRDLRTAEDAEREETVRQMRDRLPDASPDLGPGLSPQTPKSFPLADPSPLSADIESSPLCE
jgi:hypothetical protein